MSDFVLRKRKLSPGERLRIRAIERNNDPRRLPDSYRFLSQTYTGLLPKKAGRNDVSVFIKPGAGRGIGAHGYFMPAAARIVLDGDLLPCDPSELDPATNPEHFDGLAVFHGVFIHEAGHAAHTVMFDVPEGYDKQMIEIDGKPVEGAVAHYCATQLEEIRMEAQVAREHPEDVRWIKAAMRKLHADVMTGQLEFSKLLDKLGFKANKNLQVAIASIYTIGRTYAGTIDEADVKAFSDKLDELIDSDTRRRMEEIFAEAVALEDDEQHKLLGLGERLAGLFNPACDCACHSKSRDGGQDTADGRERGEREGRERAQGEADDAQAGDGDPDPKDGDVPDATMPGSCDEECKPGGTNPGESGRAGKSGAPTAEGGEGSGGCPDCGCGGEGSGQGSSGGQAQGCGEGGGGEPSDEELDELMDAAAEALSEAAREQLGEMGKDNPAREQIEQIADKQKAREKIEEARRAVGGRMAGSPGGAQAERGEREPTPQEKAARVRLSQKLREVRWRERGRVKRNILLPPGRMRGRELIRQRVDNSRGMPSQAQPWKRKRSVPTDLPVVTCGVLIDTSGSMYGTEQMLASTLWVIANAIADNGGRTGGYVFGDAVEPILSPEAPPRFVTTFQAGGGTAGVPETLEFAEKDLAWEDAYGPRLLVICSDGYWGDAESTANALTRIKEKGIVVLLCGIHHQATDYGMPELFDEQVVVSDEHELASVIGSAAVRELRNY